MTAGDAAAAANGLVGRSRFVQLPRLVKSAGQLPVCAAAELMCGSTDSVGGNSTSR